MEEKEEFEGMEKAFTMSFRSSVVIDTIEMIISFGIGIFLFVVLYKYMQPNGLSYLLFFILCILIWFINKFITRYIFGILKLLIAQLFFLLFVKEKK